MKIFTIAAGALLALGLAAAAPASAQPPQGDRHHDEHGDRGPQGGGPDGREHHGDRDRGARHGDHGMRGDRDDMRRHHGWDRRHHGWTRGHHYGWRNGRGHHCRWVYRHHHRVRVCR